MTPINHKALFIGNETESKFLNEQEQERIVRFYQRKYVPSGRYVYVTGNISALGSWDPKLALKLTHIGQNNWHGEVHIQTPGTFEYKYIIADDKQQSVIWDQGPNAKMSLSADPISLFHTAKEDIRVMTFNIRFLNDFDGPNNWDHRKDHVAEIMGKYDCDFIGLQEAFLSQTRDVQNKLSNYMWYGPGRDIGGDGEAAPIFYLHEKWKLEEASTFWLSDTPQIEGSTTYGNVIPRICTWGKFKNKLSQETFYVYNCHLDHQNKNSREKSVIQIKKHIDSNCVNKKNVILMGDLNSYYPRLVEKTIGILTSVGIEFKDTCLGWFEVLQGTFHWWTGIGLVRLDYIFIPHDWIVKDYAIIKESRNGLYPSDHFPVIAQFNPYTSSS